MSTTSHESYTKFIIIDYDSPYVGVLHKLILTIELNNKVTLRTLIPPADDSIYTGLDVVSNSQSVSSGAEKK